jgi:hypothetical protein
MKTKKILVIIACCMMLFIFSAAKKSKKTAKAKPSSEITALKNTVSGLEEQNAALKAKADKLEKDLLTLKASSGNLYVISGVSGSAAVILLIILIASASGGKPGEKREKKGKKAAPGREKHYEDLEYHVLNDWQNIWFHPENIDMKLYADLKNHFPELYSSIEDWKKAMNDRQELVEKMGKELSRLHPDVETMPYIYLLTFEEPNLFVEDTEIKSGPYVCAQSTGGNGSRDMMNAYYDSCMKMFAKSPYTDIKSLSGDISNYKSEIDLKIRKIKFTKDLPGDCGYTAV